MTLSLWRKHLEPGAGLRVRHKRLSPLVPGDGGGLRSHVPKELAHPGRQSQEEARDPRTRSEDEYAQDKLSGDVLGWQGGISGFQEDLTC